MLVDFEYYSNTYLGEPISAEEFPRAEAKAERAVHLITYGRARDFDALPAFQQQAVRDAVCAQIEYYAIMGTDVSVNGDTGGAGWTVGKVHVNGGTGAAAAKTGASTMLCAAAVAALEQTGLMNPQVDVAGALYAPYPLEVI